MRSLPNFLIRSSLFLLLFPCSINCLSDQVEDALSDPDFRLFSRDLYHFEQEPFRSYPCLPQHIHLAQATNVDEASGNLSMTVSFTLDYQNCLWADLRPLIRFAAVNETRVRTIVGIAPPIQFNYTSDKTNGNVYQSNWIYHMELPDIKAGGIQYWYRIAVVQNHEKSSAVSSSSRRRSVRGSNGYYLGETPTYYFRSPPLPGAPTVMALVGDIGQTMNSFRTMIDIYEAASSDNERSETGPLGVVTQLLIAGDLSYADADPSRWTSWLTLIEPLLRSLPLHVAAGNHEVECTSDENRAIFVPYEHYFRVPNRLGPAVSEGITDQEQELTYGCDSPSEFLGVYDYGNSFYSYQHGLVHVIVLNSYTKTTPGSPQFQWLYDELQNRFDRKRTPWLLVAFHCPFYTVFEGHVNERQSQIMKQHMEPLFLKFGVNLVISGHDHAYLRTKPLSYDNAVAKPAPIYLILGAGGNREGHSHAYRPLFHPKWEAASSIQDFGYGHWYVANATHARLRWINNNQSNAAFTDEVWMENLYINQSSRRPKRNIR